ncbi:hypothetical protein Y958_12915 [Nitrospirillum viridazoti CBAmc]|uniref:UvrD-like helicase C-terminal domain-containing protein n=2 Tax=Nitrospirillum TaxID=1543705 RepID=A0A248JSC3_9PROT|nr:hypothetical protein Y958_12915 [Nitrospirillum amazonense CBAmc]
MGQLTRLAAIGGVADLEAINETERHLFYVACTRARDRLMVTDVCGVSGKSGRRLSNASSDP